MRKRARMLREANLSVRIQRLTHEIEALVPELKSVLASEDELRHLVSSAVRSLARATSAVAALVERAKPDRFPDPLRAMLEGTSPLLSMLGSRVVLAGGGSGAGPRSPSAGAQALAVLLEDASRPYAAREIAESLGWSVPVARTTLNRLVRSGHARRVARGRFRANG